MFKVCIIQGKPQGLQRTCENQGTIVVGRSSSCDFQLDREDDLVISKKHLILRDMGDSVEVKCVGQHGMRVEGGENMSVDEEVIVDTVTPLGIGRHTVLEITPGVGDDARRPLGRSGRFPFFEEGSQEESGRGRAATSTTNREDPDFPTPDEASPDEASETGGECEKTNFAEVPDADFPSETHEKTVQGGNTILYHDSQPTHEKIDWFVLKRFLSLFAAVVILILAVVLVLPPASPPPQVLEWPQGSTIKGVPVVPNVVSVVFPAVKNVKLLEVATEPFDMTIEFRLQDVDFRILVQRLEAKDVAMSRLEELPGNWIARLAEPEKWQFDEYLVSTDYLGEANGIPVRVIPHMHFVEKERWQGNTYFFRHNEHLIVVVFEVPSIHYWRVFENILSRCPLEPDPHATLVHWEYIGAYNSTQEASNLLERLASEIRRLPPQVWGETENTLFRIMATALKNNDTAMQAKCRVALKNLHEIQDVWLNQKRVAVLAAEARGDVDEVDRLIVRSRDIFELSRDRRFHVVRQWKMYKTQTNIR
jgi:hypothetical protein